jgi:hypothetical protein
MGRGEFGALIAAAIVLALPAAASSATLCVNKLGPQCDQIYTASELGAAISKANENQTSFDRIEIGPGTYDGGPYNASSQTDIVGSGPDQTVISNATPMGFNGIELLANYPGQKVTDLGIRLGVGEYSRGLQVGGESVVERVRITAGPGSTPETGLDAFGATIREVEVQMPRDEFVTAGAGAGTIEDSTFEGGTGLFLGGGVARRVLAIGNTALTTRTSRIEDSVLRAFGPEARGVVLGQFEGGEVVLSQVTVAGDQTPGSIGLQAEKGPGAFAALSSVMTVRNTVVSGFATAISHRGFAGKGTTECGLECQIAQTTDVDYSALDLHGGVSDLGGPGSLHLGAGNVDIGDPRFADPAAGDFRPRFDSPLIDAGDPAALGSGSLYAGESPVDFGGLERVIDGRAGGTPAARRDIGAYEYGRRAPSLTIGATGQALLYQPVTIPVEASDPDPFDPLTFQFSFDGQATGANPTHVFTTLGSHTAQVLVSDPTGAASTGSTGIQVTARPGRCANRRSGGNGRDAFKGTAAGDDLAGGAGRDSLRGGNGADCLRGGKGNDFLEGGKGKDRIGGGPGDDRIASRDGKRDQVDCGPGRDTVVADRSDSPKGCEIVTSH